MLLLRLAWLPSCSLRLLGCTFRRNLVVVYLLVDASIPPQKVDLEYASWLRENNIPFAVVFTKVSRWGQGRQPTWHMLSTMQCPDALWPRSGVWEYDI
jgi:GTP-binding protein EngB required for normal cell division